jgi:hypothetical protein
MSSPIRSRRQRLDAELDTSRKRKPRCDCCGTRASAYGRTRRSWHHLNPADMKAPIFPEARSVECPSCGVTVEAVTRKVEEKAASNIFALTPGASPGDRRHARAAEPEAFKDLAGGLCPDERSWAVVMLVEEFSYVSVQRAGRAILIRSESRNARRTAIIQSSDTNAITTRERRQEANR